MTITGIAKISGVSPYTVKTYCTLFFDMNLERIDNAHTFSNGVSDRIIETIYKWRTGAHICKELGISRQLLFLLRTEKNMPCCQFSVKKIYYDIDIVRKYVKRIT